MAIDMTIGGQAIRPDDVRALSILNVMPLIDATCPQFIPQIGRRTEDDAPKRAVAVSAAISLGSLPTVIASPDR